MNDLDDYANSMFRYEHLHDAWIDRCAAYLKHIFGDAIFGKTVVDYAFGRGNWSVAFVRAGAAKVIAIDASASNVERFQAHCRIHSEGAIDVVHGNVLDAPINVRGDILWLYGILPAIQDQPEFIAKVLSLVAAGDDALVMAYGYNANSLRQFIVDSARATITYTSEAAFRADSLRFTPAGRMRARDDLMAPHVNWHTAEALAELFYPFGFHPTNQFDDFRIWDSGYSDDEFAPIHLLLKRGLDSGFRFRIPRHPFRQDIELLRRMWAQLMTTSSPLERKDIAISAFNTHFSHLTEKGEAEASVLQLYLLLLYGLRNKNMTTTNDPAADFMLKLGDDAIRNVTRQNSSEWESAFLVRYLQQNPVRI